MLLLPAITARAEAGKDIHAGDIAAILFGAAAVFFLGNLALAAAVFYGGNALGNGKRRRKIWGTYGMSMLGTLFCFAGLRNGSSSSQTLLVSIVLWALAFAVIGYLCSPVQKDEQADEEI